MSGPENRDDDADVIVQHQAEVSIYANTAGGVTIRSEDYAGTEQLIAFAPVHAEKVVAAVRKAAREASDSPARPMGAPDDLQALIDRAFAARVMSSRERIILLALAFHSDADVEAPPLAVLSYDELSGMTSLGVAAVAEVLNDLEERGWIETTVPAAAAEPSDARHHYSLFPARWAE